MTTSRLGARRVRFEHPEGMDPVWNRRLPELSTAANAVSLLMPHVEPYVVRSVRAALPGLDPALRAEAEDYLRQESSHHAQHHKLNVILARHYPRLGLLERVMARTFGWLSRRRSASFNLAFAAGFETVAFASARWTSARVGRLFPGADPVPATLFLWHLGEEVEHKTVAHDVHRAAGGGRLTYLVAMVTSMLLLAAFTVAGILVMFQRDGRLFSPRSHARLFVWSFSFLFELLPMMAVSVLPGHHPSQLTDPPWLTDWLGQFDPATGTMPEWSMGFLDA